MSYFIERRKHYRVYKEIKVRYKFITPDSTTKEQFFEATTKNISTTGILLKATIPRPELLSEMMQRKILVFLEITLPKNDAPIMTTAQLRWVESIDLNNNIYHLGLKFVDISSEDRNILTKFILQHI